MPTADSVAEPSTPRAVQRHGMGFWIAIGLVSGIVCGVFFGEYCEFLQVFGMAYVGLLQMTVLPYLVLSLISKLGRLDAKQAKELGITAVKVLLILWCIGIGLIVLISEALPPIQGASFFSPIAEQLGSDKQDFLDNYIPSNIFHSLSNEAVPAVVVFCLFFGSALISIPTKEPVLDFLDLCGKGISRMNSYLIRLAPIGLFTLTAAAAGTMQLQELSRLQAYLIMFVLVCLVAAFGILPLLLSSLTQIPYRVLMRAAQEPLFTVIATGKLFVVLPQIVNKCEELLSQGDQPHDSIEESTPSMVVPLAYPFAHLGKILAFVFISFAAWYSGKALTPFENLKMATTGAVTSFASPLISMPFLLDQYKLSQDLMAFFILPGFITMRIADVVGVLHLMVLSLIVTRKLQNRIVIQWKRLGLVAIFTVGCIFVLGVATHTYLASTTLNYDLDKKFLALELQILHEHEDVVVYRNDEKIPERNSEIKDSTLNRINTEKRLRVGYHPDHLPYSFFNSKGHLVGLDVDLMHRLAQRLKIKLEFVPSTYETVLDQLESDDIDLAIGGLLMTPERLTYAGFSSPYQKATISVVLPDHRRAEMNLWLDPEMPPDLRLAVVSEDLAQAAQIELPNVEIVTIESARHFFEQSNPGLDGLIVAAEEGAAWTVLYPEYSVVIPQPVIEKPVSFAVNMHDLDWQRFLDLWLEYERLDGSIDRLRVYWIEGGGTQKLPPRWCIVRDVLHWLP